MKKLLLIVVAIAVVVGGAFAATYHYKNYQNKKALETKAAAVEAAKAKEAELQPFMDRVSELKGQYNSQVAECEKGRVAYDKLSQAVKNQTPAPVCGTTL